MTGTNLEDDSNKQKLKQITYANARDKGYNYKNEDISLKICLGRRRLARAMGKTSKWLKTFLMGKKEKDKKKGENVPSTLPTKNHSAPIPVPSPKENKRWSFRRSAANTLEASASAPAAANGLSESEMEQKRHALAVAVATAAAADAAVAAAQAAAAVVRLTATANGSSRANRPVEEDAATKIQSCFRSYLARKALCALKGLVMLQALVRGDLVRRQTTETLRRMQALVIAQVRARAQRIQMIEEAQTNSQRQPNHRTSPKHPRFRQLYETEKNAEENIKIVEMDLGQPRSSSKSRNSYSIPQSERIDHRNSTYYSGSRTPSKADIQQHYSRSPSAYTDLSPKACSAHFEEFSFATAQSSPQYFSAMSIADSTPTSIDYSFFPSYMANTESSRAKARSQSAPRQRLDSYERQSSRRRPSTEGRNIPKGVKMQRSASQVSIVANGYQFPWSLKLDRSNVSLKDSECGSTSTVMTNYKYCNEFYGDKF